MLELLIAIAIVGGLAWLGGTAIARARGSKLRDAGALLASQLRFAFDRALATGKHHRLVIQIEENRFWVEECRRRMPVRRGTDPEEEREREEKEEDERKARAAEAIEAATRERASDEAPEEDHPPPDECSGEPTTVLDEAGADAATPPCCRPRRGGDVLKFKRGVKFAAVEVAHLGERVMKGQVRINFFPMGYGEKSVVYLSDRNIASEYEFEEAKPWSVLLEPLTGRVRVMTRPPTEEEGGAVRKDATGEETDDK